MAEAAVENLPRRFFCHKCTQEIRPVLPDYTCPHCQCGFIEELSQNTADSTSDSAEEDVGPAGPYSEIMSVIIDGLTSDPDTASIFDPEDGGGFRRLRRNRSQGGNLGHARLLTRRRASSDRGVAPFEGLIQQILTNLAGATGIAGTANAGLPIFFNLHGNPGDYAWGNRGLDAVITQLLNQLDGTGPPPLPREKIDQIPTVSISQDQVDIVLQCTVCMEDFKLGESVRRLACLHHFHTDCIVPWLELHGTCPICRKSLNDGEESDSPSPDAGSDASRGGGGGHHTSNVASNPATSNSIPTSTNTRSNNSNSSQQSNPAVFDFIEEFD